MAVVLHLDSLSQEIRTLIQQLLNVTEEMDYMKQNLGGTPKTIQAFVLNDRLVHLPYYFGNSLGIKTVDVLSHKAGVVKVESTTGPVKFVLPGSENKAISNREPLQPLNFKIAWRKNLEEDLDQEEVYHSALKLLKERKTVTLNLTTGYGKTAISVALTCSLFSEADSIIIALRNAPLKNNWPLEFKTFTNATVHVMETATPPKNRPHVYVAMASQLPNIPLEHRTNCILVIDEAHKFCVPDSFPKLLEVIPKFTIALTATTNRSDKMYQIMEAVTGLETHLKRVQKKNLTVLRYETGFTPTIEKNKMGVTKWDVYVKSCIECKLRTERLAYIASVVMKDKKILIGVYYKMMADKLYDIFKAMGESVSKFYGTSKKYQDARILVAVIPKMREGVDAKSTAINFSGVHIDTVILWVSLKELLALEQFVGRGFRSDNPLVVFCEDKHKISHRHWLACKKWFEERKATFLHHKEPDIPKLTTYYSITGEKIEA